MTYRFVKVTSFYPQYLSAFYDAHPDIAQMGYAQQLDAVMDDGYSWADFFKKHLSKNFGVDAHEIIHNAEPLQSAWAKENGTAAVGTHLVFEQLAKLNPDVVFLQDAFTFSSEWMAALKEKIPSIKLTLGWCCAPFTNVDVDRFKNLDIIMTCSPGFVEAFRAKGLNAHCMLHGFEAALLNRHPGEPALGADVLFSGSLVAGAVGHNERRELLEELIRSGVNIKMFGTAEITKAARVLLLQGAYHTYHAMRNVGLEQLARKTPFLGRAKQFTHKPTHVSYSKELLNRLEAPVFGQAMYQALADAKICLNTHGAGAEQYACNMRMYEATGMGTCLVTDWKKNLGSLFELDREVVAYKNSAECLEKLKWLVEHPQERAAIAKAGQARTLKSHTYEMRAEQLNKIILSILKNPK